jgi:hypothetical protein
MRGARGEMKQLTRLDGEKSAHLDKAFVALDGKLATVRAFEFANHVAYSRTAGVVALSLNNRSTFGIGEEPLVPVVVFRVPAW